MCRGMCFLLLLLDLPASNALALSIRNEGSNSSAPFELTYQNVQSPLVIVLQVANESDMTASVLSWQLGSVERPLELRPLGAAQGDLLFQSATAPPDSLFGQSPGPQSDLSISSAMISAFDVDPNFVGEPVMQNSVRNILQLTLGATAETTGAFQLLMPEVEDPEADSSWFDVDEFAPKTFENSAVSAFAGFVLLGTINVGETPSFAPGDYNLDHRVDSTDYDRWRTDFGNSVSTLGEGADGNRNGIVDAADYVVWRDDAVIQGGNGANISGAAVPEPGGRLLMIFGWASIAGVVHRLPRRHCGQFARSTRTVRL